VVSLVEFKRTGKHGKGYRRDRSGQELHNRTRAQGDQKIVLTKGLDAAEIYAAQLTGTDQNTELMRVFEICRKYGLSPEAVAQVIDKLNVIESGKW